MERDKLFRDLVRYMSNGDISVETFNISVYLLKKFTKKSIPYLEMYETEHMTIVFEFEKGDNYLCLENGNKEMSYFYEINDKVENMYDLIDPYDVKQLKKDIRKILR